MNDSKKRYAAFLSFANQDRDLVKMVYGLFGDVGLPTYFAPSNLPQHGTPDWRHAILDAVRDSASFVPIVTRHSLIRSWVLFESGAADAAGINHFPARVSSVRLEDMASIPKTHESWVFELSRFESIKDLIRNVYREFRGSRELERNSRTIDTAIRGSKHTEPIMKLAEKRSVFIAGSVPNDLADLRAMTINGDPALQEEKALEKMADGLTRALLEADFDVASCSEVPHVGASVADAANNWLSDRRAPIESDRYTIGGLYPIDRERREADMDPRERTQWQNLFMKYRASYLVPHEWLLVLGGNDGTQEEIDAARALRTVKVCSIPSIGGVGRTYWKKSRSFKRGPLDPTAKSWSASMLNDLVTFLKEN